MAEEHRFQSQEGHRLCANNCGFFGSPATLNLCSKCYRDHFIKEEQTKSVKSAVENSLFCSSSAPVADLPSSTANFTPETSLGEPVASPEDDAVFVPVQQVSQPNRCLVCRKRVGLTGFNCRCGITFCGTHRYPEQHGCTFDFKGVGREAIARDNPVVIAEKLEKI